MCPRRSYILDPLKEADSGPKGGKILWNYKLEVSFKGLKYMVSADTLLNNPDWDIFFIIHNDDSYKQMGSVISHNNKSVAFFSGIVIRLKRKCTTA